uniref:Large ribosomal subunit protein eL24-related N-terminal domain-containing protein n=1 Tax=Arcella intermedia TaxID=1963864 RepID=A0A6B2LNM6_9EUKA|eukprot:TRINITY_DN26722_c0_g1_i1.p1 TRINITY_DN26722_c0_g1~~TRINITY_DN26722_c0_g1_i1.p1  ORF type:complete len:149 (+),score=27.01 TRINITY_DN26722_c0_g1_i1:68-514(+)
MKTETCSFSGWKVYPGHGTRFIKADCKIFLFRSSKEEAFFHQRQKAAKLRWTLVYRRLHKKGVSETRSRKKRHGIKKTQRAVQGVDMEKVASIRKENPEKAKERREANLAQLRERRAKAKAAAGAKPAHAQAAQPKGPKQKGTGNKGR